MFRVFLKVEVEDAGGNLHEKRVEIYPVSQSIDFNANEVVIDLGMYSLEKVIFSGEKGFELPQEGRNVSML